MFENNKELRIEQIDFKWVDETNDAKLLKKGLKLLKDDGGFFPELEKEIEEKLKNIDKKFKVILESNKNIPKEEIERQKADLLDWEESINRTEKMINYSNNFKKPNQKDENLTKIQNEKEAENEKFKGNELMKTKEFEEAIKHYDNSIRLNSSEPTTYCNRALALIKTKKYQRALEDCETAINIKRDYSKAYYRRAVCYLNMRDFRKSWNDLIYILKESPTSQEILSEIKSVLEKWKTELGKEEFSKIEQEINNEYEEAKAYVKSDRPIINKNDENKPIISKEQNQTDKDTKTIEKINEQQTLKVNNEQTSKKGFKKIQILEEEIPEDNVQQPKSSESKKENKFDNKIDDELRQKFDFFMKSGQQVKEKLNQLIAKNNKKEAQEITRNCLKDCQNFIKLFKQNTKQHSDIENSINELNTLLNSLEEKPNVPEDKKYYKTKIFSEESRENATKIAEEDFKFDDFPKSAYGFEKAFNSFKKRIDVYYSYLKYVGFKIIPDLYKNNEITYNLLAGIIQAIKNYGIESDEDINFSMNMLEVISKTKNFHLLKKFLKKSDKEDLKFLFEKIKSKSENLLIVNASDVEKLYL